MYIHKKGNTTVTTQCGGQTTLPIFISWHPLLDSRHHEARLPFPVARHGGPRLCSSSNEEHSQKLQSSALRQQSRSKRRRRPPLPSRRPRPIRRHGEHPLPPLALAPPRPLRRRRHFHRCRCRLHRPNRPPHRRAPRLPPRHLRRRRRPQRRQGPKIPLRVLHRRPRGHGPNRPLRLRVLRLVERIERRVRLGGRHGRDPEGGGLSRHRRGIRARQSAQNERRGARGGQRGHVQIDRCREESRREEGGHGVVHPNQREELGAGEVAGIHRHECLWERLGREARGGELFETVGLGLHDRQAGGVEGQASGGAFEN
mmetsp:Transcript_23463/g.45019  ORF Transcript_23463/g.45019 Transcript_23463/m.45019 type:complete len:314 (+) Transcript_23463:3-944(+)